MDDLYDVVFFGLQDGQEMDAVNNALAAAFSIPVAKAAQLTLKPSGTLIKKGVTLEVAQRYQTLLMQAGVKANYKPAVTANQLKRVPIEKSKQQCPACNEVLEWNDGEEEPSVCPHCGVVFKKFKENQERQQEAAEIRERLQKIQALQTVEASKEQERISAENRRQTMEEQLRREMGLPNIVNTRARLWSSAAGTLVFGIAAGVVISKVFFGPSGQLQPDANSMANRAVAPIGMDFENITGDATAQLAETLQAITKGGVIDPQQLAALSQTIIAQVNPDALAPVATQTDNTTGAEPTTETTATLDPELQTEQRTTNQPATATGQDPVQVVEELSTVLATVPENTLTSRELLAGLQTTTDQPALMTWHSGSDQEWDFYLYQRVSEQIHNDDLWAARTLTNAIDGIALRLQAQVEIAVGYLRLGQQAETNTLLEHSLETLANKPDVMERMTILADLMPTLADAGMRIAAIGMLSQAMEWIEQPATTLTPAQQAGAWSKVALAQAHLQLLDEARASLNKASQALKESMTADQRVQAMAWTAEAFAHLQADSEARAILEQAEALTRTITSERRRNQALTYLLWSWVHGVHDLQQSMTIASQLSSIAVRDHVLYAVIHQQAQQQAWFGLPSLLDMISAPFLQARGLAFLGRTQTDPERAKVYFKRALATAASLESVIDRIRIDSEIARYLSRFDSASSENLFKATINRISELTTDADRDLAWLTLARDSVRAFNPKQAQAALAQMKSPGLRDKANQDVKQTMTTLALLQK
jgi:tetratricopeptide (TPR) repeat protein/uncharacterized Zn finger protein (UPF0148 family)